MSLLGWIFGNKKKPKLIKAEHNREDNSTTKIYSDGSFIFEQGLPPIEDKYFKLSETIVNTRLPIDERICACEASYEILPEIIRIFKSEGSIPPCIACRDYGIDLYFRLGKWSAAAAAIQKCSAAGAFEDATIAKEIISELAEYKKAAEAAVSWILVHPGFQQNKIYDALPKVSRDALKRFTRSSRLLVKKKVGNTNALYIDENALLKSDIEA